MDLLRLCNAVADEDFVSRDEKRRRAREEGGGPNSGNRVLEDVKKN